MSSQVYVGLFGAPRRPQDGPKTVPRCPKTAPRRPKTSQDAPKTAQEAPKTPPRRSKTPKIRFQTFPSRPETPPKCLQEVFLAFLPPETRLVQSDADFHVESDTNNDWERNPHISMKTKKKKTLENKLVGYLIGRGSYLGAPVLSLPKR